MAKEKKKKEASEINEELMMNLMVDGIKKEGLQLPQGAGENFKEKIKPEKSPEKNEKRQKTRSRQRMKIDYEVTFFKNPDTQARDGKTVYIRPDFHEKLLRMVQVIGDNKISIYAYLDNVLEHHFEEFGKEIIKSFNDKYKPIL